MIHLNIYWPKLHIYCIACEVGPRRPAGLRYRWYVLINSSRPINSVFLYLMANSRITKIHSINEKYVTIHSEAYVIMQTLPAVGNQTLSTRLPKCTFVCMNNVCMCEYVWVCVCVHVSCYDKFAYEINQDDDRFLFQEVIMHIYLRNIYTFTEEKRIKLYCVCMCVYIYIWSDFWCLDFCFFFFIVAKI